MAYSDALTALTTGLKDGGCSFVANYPGSRSQEIFFGLGGENISLNERTAFEMAYGSSLSGRRSVVTMKNVGINACADPFLHSMISGVQGGLVVIISDDTKVVASQERQDSRHYIDFFGGLWLEPSTPSMAYDMAYEAFTLSEQLDVPVVIRLTNQFFDAQGEYIPKPAIQGTRTLASNPEKYISYPVYWKRQSENLQKKNDRIREFVEQRYSSIQVSPTSNVGVITFGACDEELAQIIYENYDSLSINIYPLPKDTVRRFVENRSKVVVLEQGDDYGASLISTDQGKLHLPFTLETNTGDCRDDPQRWHLWSHLEKLFTPLKSIHPAFVVGDVGQYTVESTHSVDACLCLGSAVGVGLGMAEAGIPFPFCISGDGAFLHSNTQALSEALTRNSKLGIIVLDNGGSGATGGQPLIADIRKIDPRIPTYEIDYEEATSEDFEQIFSKMRTDNQLAVLFVTIPIRGSS